VAGASFESEERTPGQTHAFWISSLGKRSRRNDLVGCQDRAIVLLSQLKDNGRDLRSLKGWIAARQGTPKWPANHSAADVGQERPSSGWTRPTELQVSGESRGTAVPDSGKLTSFFPGSNGCTTVILKQIRLSRHLSQEQLAEMAGLNVRTIQRIESGSNASVESLKCIAAALDVDIQTLEEEQFVMETNTENWRALPAWLKCWFYINLWFSPRVPRSAIRFLHWTSHIAGFLLCCLGWVSEPALAGGIIMLAYAHLLTLLTWQGDRYGIWYEPVEPA